MRYCLNPWCPQRQNTDDVEVCQQCGTSLLIHDRFWLVRPLRPFDDDGYYDVFEAIDTTGSYIAPPGSSKVLKVLRLGYGHEKLIPSLQHEARALRLLKHPGIPKSDMDDDFTWVFTHDDREVELHCLAIQKFEGETLDDWLEAHGPISQERALSWLKEMADILHCVHQAEIIHRDIKPSNIVVQPDNKLALIDFGGADIKGYSMKAQADAYAAPLIGTLRYTPQEQIKGHTLPESDFYTLGLTMISAVCGKPLHEISSDPKTFERLWRPEAPQIDSPLAAFLDRLSSPRVWDRPRNYELVDLVEQLPKQIKRHQKFRSSWFRIGAGLFLLIISTSGWFLGHKLIDFGKFEFAMARGLANLTSNRSSEAQNDFREAISLDPDSDKAHYHLALSCAESQDYECAVEQYQIAIKLQPKRWESHYAFGSFYDDLAGVYVNQQKPDLAKKMYRSAERLYQDAHKQDPSVPGPLNNLARLALLRQNSAQGMMLSEKALALTNKPNTKALILKNLGWASLLKNDINAAKMHLMMSKQLDPNIAATYCLLNQIQSNAQNQEACISLPSTQIEVRQWRQALIKKIEQRIR